MKLLTTIPPRRDGTVILRVPSDASRAWTFTDQGDGVLVCDVDDDAALTFALRSGMFEPLSEDDFLRAEQLLGLGAQAASDDDEDEDEDDLGDEDAAGEPPQEANTPPSRARARNGTPARG